jgi:hypothetical protein
MKDYLRSLIQEQINRGLCLKELIHHPRESQVLSGLAERCKLIIDNNVQELRFLLRELQEREEDDVRDIFRETRACTRAIERVEYFGISALYFESPDIGYLNNLVFQIHREIKLPLNSPSVACISTKYYYFHPFTNVIFVPVGESRFLLHLPDVFHEIGHQVLSEKENELSLKKVSESYRTAIRVITSYYDGLLKKKMRETGPRAIPATIALIHYQWKTYWINEFFCDLFALYTLGPAYAWAHLHLTTKKSEDVYEFSPILPRSHPSDDSRMKMLTIGLTKIGLGEMVPLILSRWNEMPLIANTKPVIEYQYAYPDDLMNQIADIFLTGLKDTGFALATQKGLEEENSTIISLLNKAWTLFWENPEAFTEWETQTVKGLKNRLSQINSYRLK